MLFDVEVPADGHDPENRDSFLAHDEPPTKTVSTDTSEIFKGLTFKERIFSESDFENDNVKTKFYTGLPAYYVLL